MTEDPIIIQMNIAHYGAMLKLGMGDEKRTFIERLLAEAKRDLALATASKNSNSARHKGGTAPHVPRHRDYRLPRHRRRARKRAGHGRS